MIKKKKKSAYCSGGGERTDKSREKPRREERDIIRPENPPLEKKESVARNQVVPKKKEVKAE